MRLLIITYGTEGDARPLAALGSALMRAGHSVHLLGDADTLDTATTLGVPATGLAGDIRGTLSRMGAMRQIERALIRIVEARTPEWMQQAMALAEGCDAVIVSGLTAFVGLSVAEARGVPAIGAMMIPISPTAAFASPLVPLRVPRALNRLSHDFVNGMVWRTFRATTNRGRAAIGLPARRTLPMAHPVLYGISPALLPNVDDWPADAVACGQWVPPSQDWTPPAALQALLGAGPPPVYIGFGSMSGFDAARVREAVVAAVGDRRTLFNPGWSGIDTTGLPPNIHVIGSAPHDWLLPRCALAIHHGGSGTTHSACRAGIPSVILPFAGDQPFWARRLRALGIADRVLSGRRPSARRLAAAIAFAERAETRAHAAALGARMQDEDGCAAAVAWLERRVAPAGAGAPAG
ncbi:glycosyltransferase [Luteimonas sp. 100069]|uniref:glycosyltransferase n=1 Tax=Luteimonas sp. 100069 TaxID=2006109 RepID=UPI000F5017F6|nr:glycosyltransferase [Luteimonas sp. 100069]RPD85214.1 glycosyltransferase [Luteimonas sp. 100069]